MIFWREKVLLELIKRNPNKRVSKMQIINWLFLLKFKEEIDKQGSFYEFLPYKYGPFSFLAYKDINNLEETGLIKTEGKYIVNNEKNDLTYELKDKTINSIKNVLNQFSCISTIDLTEYIHQNYSWYASKNQNFQGSLFYQIPIADKAIYTLGYESFTIDGFLNVLLKEGIQIVVDVRSNPISRKYGFSKSAIKKKCNELGLYYFHFPQVGISTEIRNQVHDVNELWSYYTQNIIPNNSKSISEIISITLSKPSALICFEKNPEDCHRHILAEEISNKTWLPIINYRGENQGWEKR